MDELFFQNVLNRIKDIDEQLLKEKIGNRLVYIWGADYKGEQLAECLTERGIYISGFLDSGILDKNGKINVHHPSEIISKGSNDKYFVFVSMLLKHKNFVHEFFEENLYTRNDYFFPADEWSFVRNIWNITHSEELIQRQEQGKRIMNSLDNNKFYFFLYGGHIGDEIIALSWIYTLKKEKKIFDITVITSENYAGLARLYKDDINDILIWDKNELENTYLYLKNQKDTQYNIVGYDWSFIPKERMVPYPIAQIMFKTKHLGINYFAKSKYIKGYGFEDINVKRILSANKIKQGKSIILVPYAQSACMLPIEFWEELVKYLSLQYEVYTNVVGKEQPVAGTKPVYIPLEYVIDVVNYAGTAISIRCGLTDVLALGKCNCQVLYYIKNDVEENYANVNRLYINGEESILNRNAYYVYKDFDTKYEVKKSLEYLQKLGVNL